MPDRNPKQWKTSGASVIGPAHRANGQPNQDAWRRFIGPFGTGIVVCDGLGSKPYSDKGARLACKAVAQAVRIWAKEQAPDEHLLRLIHNLWNMKVNSLGARDCATTCLFAIALRSGDMLVAQLGDGIALLRLAEQGFR